MTNQDMIDRIKDNLGNRVSGRIGSRSVDTVVLEALNLAIPHITQEAQPDYYNRIAELSLTVLTREYALPTQDSDGDTIIIKDIHSHRCSRAGGTEVMMSQLNYAAFVKRVADYDMEFVGMPSLFSLWGKANKLYLDYIPSEPMTLTLFVEVYPNPVISEGLNSALLSDQPWDLAIEAFATQHCYLKLQQTEMYAVWNDLYLKQKASISRTESQKHSKNISASGQTAHVNDPVLNPFVNGWN